MAGDSSSRQLANLKEVAARVESSEGLTRFLAMAARMLVASGDFGATAISAVRDNDYCETLAVAGPDSLKQAILGTRFALSSYEAELATAEVWGALRYVAIEHSAGIAILHPARDEGVTETAGPTIAGCLYAPLYADSGRLIGMISAEISDADARPGIVAQRSMADIAGVVAEAMEAQLAPEDRQPPSPAAVEPNAAATGNQFDRTSDNPAGNPAGNPSGNLSGNPSDGTSDRDLATGLPNREGLETAFSATLERMRKDGTTAAVLYLVLEEYDAISASLGSEVADEVLRRVTKRLQDSVRTYDVIARVSQNSMAIVADNIAPGDTGTLVSRLRRTLAKVHIVDNEVIRVRGSVGAVLVDDKTPDTTSAFEKAQDACEAERTGANSTYLLYSRYSRPSTAVTSLR